MSVSVCLRGYLRNHKRDLDQIFVHVAFNLPMARSSSGVVEIRYVLPVLWMTSCFFYSGLYSGMNFATKDSFRLNLLVRPTVKSDRIQFPIIKGHNFD